MNSKWKIMTGVSILIALMISGCDYKAEPNLYDPNEKGATTPDIVSITPDSNFSAEDITFAGEGVVKIDGHYFSNEKSFNIAYFDGVTGKVLDATETSLRVKVPYVIGDSVNVKVSVQDAFNFGQYGSPLPIMAADVEIGGFDEYTLSMFSVTADNDENIFVSTGTEVRMIAPDSITTNSLHNSTIFSGISSMKMGPDGYIYFIQATALSRFTPLGVSESLWFKILAKGATDLDFASANELYISTRSSGSPSFADIYLFKMDTGTYTAFPLFENMHTTSIRVYDGALYVATNYIGTDSLAYKNAVWKCTILGDSLSSPELYANFDDYDASGDTKISAITFSEIGVLYIGTTSGPALLKYENGNYITVYNDILTGPTKSFVWGNGTYLYMVRLASANGTQRVVRVDLREEGALYFGR